jgi:thymidylate synthase
MRSNDAIFGFKNDRAWQHHVLTKLAADLNVEVGNITWQVGSLHVYARHFFLVDHFAKTGELNISKEELLAKIAK